MGAPAPTALMRARLAAETRTMRVCRNPWCEFDTGWKIWCEFSGTLGASFLLYALDPGGASFLGPRGASFPTSAKAYETVAYKQNKKPSEIDGRLLQHKIKQESRAFRFSDHPDVPIAGRDPNRTPTFLPATRAHNWRRSRLRERRAASIAPQPFPQER